MEQMEQDDDSDHPFGEYEEEAIASLIIDHPDFFSSIARFLKYELFNRVEVQYVVATLLDYYNRYGVFPTRGMLLDKIKKNLTVDDLYHQDIISIAERESDPREVPALKESIMEWARAKAYGLLYDPDTIAKYKKGDYEALEAVIEEARNIRDVGTNTFWFFDEIDKLFVQDNIEHFTTGFTQLDRLIHEGGPTRKEMLVWMAPTGIGKSLMLINNAVANILRGRNVLYATLEMSDILSALRALGSITGKPINQRFDMRDEIMCIVNRIKSENIGDLAFQEFQPDETSVDDIYALVDKLRKTRGWMPDIVCVDYLELMISRRSSDQKEEYVRQKSVANQVRGFAKSENVFVFTATQTNRGGNNSDSVIDVTKIAESYGKSMPIDYLISINQSTDEYEAQFDDHERSVHNAGARMYVVKNRNGMRGRTIPITINYNTMRIREPS